MTPGSLRPDAEVRENRPPAAHSSQRLRAAVEAHRQGRLVDTDPGELLRLDDELQSAGAAAVHALVVILDPAGRIVWISRTCERDTGYTSAELEGKLLHETPLASDESDDFRAVAGRVRSSEGPVTYESRAVSKDGRRLRLIWSLTKLVDDMEPMDYIVGMGMDASDRQSAEQASQLEEMRLNSLLDISQKASELSQHQIIQHTLEEVVRLTQSEIGYLHFVNRDQETIHLCNWSEEALRHCTAAHDAHYPLSAAGVWADCARLKRPVVHNDYQSLAGRKGYPEGHSHLVRHVSVPILDGDRVVIILGVGNKADDYDDADIRQMLLAADSLWKIILRKQAEEELRQHVRALEEADRQKDEFLAMLAHELRNPLAPICAALELLDRTEADFGSVRNTSQVISRQIRHMTRLVDDLLDVSRIRCGKIELQKELLDLTEVITDAIELNRDFIEIRKHQLSVSQPAVPVVVDGDRVRLTQVVSNLLHNAAKYMPDGGQIGVLIDQFEEHAVIRVKDTGVGIAPAMLSRVFDLFVQADESLDRSQGGLGLGLTLVRQLVELHGGTVEACSAGLQQGSEFVVRLPLVRDAAARLSASREDARSLADAAAYRILIVDDNEDAAAMLAELLGLLGHQVECVHDGRSALDVLDSFRPEVVLLDIGLPGMDGYQVAAQIRRKYARDAMLLIALTGYGHEQAVQRGREAGFDHHLVKPLNLHALSKLLAQPRIPRGVE